MSVVLNWLIAGVPLVVWVPASGLSVVIFFDYKIDLTPKFWLVLQFAVTFVVMWLLIEVP